MSTSKQIFVFSVGYKTVAVVATTEKQAEDAIHKISGQNLVHLIDQTVINEIIIVPEVIETAMSKDPVEQIDALTTDFKRQILDHIDFSLTDFQFGPGATFEITLPKPVVLDLLPTKEEVLALRNFQIMENICNDHDLSMSVELETKPAMPNEGLFQLTVKIAVKAREK